MGRKREGVTLDNSEEIKAYFTTAMSDAKRSGSLLLNLSDWWNAKNDLDSIKRINFCDVTTYRRELEKFNCDPSEIRRSMLDHTKDMSRPDPDALNAWVIQYISENGWKRCLNNIRQSRYALKKHGLTEQIRIDRDVARKIRDLAEREGLSVSEYLGQLIDKQSRN